MAKMKKLLVVVLIIALPLGCTTWYKYDRPLSEWPESEIKQDRIDCYNHAVLECSKVEDPFAVSRCRKIHSMDCLAQRGWHERKGK